MTLETFGYRLNRDQSVVVSTDYYYTPITEGTPPIGAKVIVADKEQGIGYIRAWSNLAGWTHWAPMPKFRSEE